jgi:hypothetical protein
MLAIVCLSVSEAEGVLQLRGALVEARHVVSVEAAKPAAADHEEEVVPGSRDPQEPALEAGDPLWALKGAVKVLQFSTRPRRLVMRSGRSSKKNWRIPNRSGRGWKAMPRVVFRIPRRGTKPSAGSKSSPMRFQLSATSQRSFG